MLYFYNYTDNHWSISACLAFFDVQWAFFVHLGTWQPCFVALYTVEPDEQQ